MLVAKINITDCIGCGDCVEICPKKAIPKSIIGYISTIAEIDEDKCNGCGKCFKVCIRNGLKMKKGKAMINQKNCRGCGRCVRECPNDAITISIDDYNRIDELIARFESRVDISG